MINGKYEIKRGDVVNYFNGERIIDVKVISVRRKKDKPTGKNYKVNGRDYRLRAFDGVTKTRALSKMDEVIYWQPDRTDFTNIY